jgi:hypothetical protein
MKFSINIDKVEFRNALRNVHPTLFIRIDEFCSNHDRLMSLTITFHVGKEYQRFYAGTQLKSFIYKNL